MIHKVGYIKDVIGNNYLALKFNEEELKGFISEFKSILNDDDLYKTMVLNQSNRDKNEFHSHHSTIINVAEINKLFKTMGSSLQEKISTIQSLDIIDLEFKGIGKAEKKGNTAYFIVLNSSTLDGIRESMGLSKRDFHITLGFDTKDVFGVSKNTVITQ